MAYKVRCGGQQVGMEDGVILSGAHWGCEVG